MDGALSAGRRLEGIRFNQRRNSRQPSHCGGRRASARSGLTSFDAEMANLIAAADKACEPKSPQALGLPSMFERRLRLRR